MPICRLTFFQEFLQVSSNQELSFTKKLKTRQSGQAGPAGKGDFYCKGFSVKCHMQHCCLSLLVNPWAVTQFPVPTQPWDSLSTLQMSGRTLARQLCAEEARKQPDNLPAIIKIYQWPKVSDLKLWERKKGRKSPSTLFLLKRYFLSSVGRKHWG